jgi:hypothetical protein
MGESDNPSMPSTRTNMTSQLWGNSSKGAIPTAEVRVIYEELRDRTVTVSEDVYS